MGPQNYPRIHSAVRKRDGLLDVTQLVPHTRKISRDTMEKLIDRAIKRANQKSSRAHFSVPPDASPAAEQAIYRKAGQELFRYFKKYCGDPASTAHQICGKRCREVGQEAFRNRTVQKGRMNSGWRYQFLLLDSAIHSRRFQQVSDIGAAEADLNAVIEFLESDREPLSLYVSVKNRKNTMGGQDWPKAIVALERVASTDKNRTGPYCCVFAIAMDKGERHIKLMQRTGQAYSVNTEVWLSDFLWPFFANYSYEEVMSMVLDVLIDSTESTVLSAQVDIPNVLLDAFAEACMDAGLIDEDGIFNDPHRLIAFFCS